MSRSSVISTAIFTTGQQVSKPAVNNLFANANANFVELYTSLGDGTTLSVTPVGLTLISQTSVAAQRTTLGLGTIAVQDASNVAITGGSVSGVTLSASTATVTSGLTLTGSTVTGGTFTGGAFNGTVGATTPSTGVFTTLTANAGVILSPASANVVLSPTGTGTVTINPATSGSLNNVVIGGTAAAAGTFTALNSTSGALNGTLGAITPAAATVTTLVVTQASSDAQVQTLSGAVDLRMVARNGVGDGLFGTISNHSLNFYANNAPYGQLSSAGQWVFGGLPGSESLRAVPVASAVERVSAYGAAAAGVPSVRSEGASANLDFGVTPKGTGVLKTGYNVTVAATPASFSATRTLAFKDGSGTTYYIPATTATW